MKLFEVEKISYYAPNKGYAVNLLEINGNLQFSVLINSAEVQPIALALEGIQPPRPMTHDIILDIFNSTDVKLEKVEIYKVIKGVFCSKLHIKNFHIGEKQIDCRPSDAIAIALRFCCPIYVSANVLNNIKSKEMILDSSFSSIQEYQMQDSSRDIIEKLNFALEEAINKENYEVAAKLRDKINSLDSTK